MPAADAADRALAASIAADTSWARTPDRAARTAPARAGLWAKFEAEADPDGVLDPDERARRAKHLQRAHFSRLALTAARSRRQARELLAAAEAAEIELQRAEGQSA